MSKLKDCGLRPESVGTVSKVKIWCRFTEFGHRSLFLNRRKKSGSTDQGERNLSVRSVNKHLNFTGCRIKEYV